MTTITYRALYHRVCAFANALKAQGVKAGDRVLIYMPMSIEAVIAMQACARIAAIHSVVFGGFSAKASRNVSPMPRPIPSSPPTAVSRRPRNRAQERRR